MKIIWCKLFHRWYGKESQVYQNVIAKLYKPAFNFNFYCQKCDKIYWTSQ